MAKQTMKRVPVIELDGSPAYFKEALKEFYKGCSIGNRSFVRYPQVGKFDGEDADPRIHPDIDKWIFEQGVVKEDGYVLIHFDW